MPRYVALLRGINVGGKHPIKMADLRACFEEQGFDDVATYIQSGNVLFGSTASGSAALTAAIERMLSVALRLRGERGGAQPCADAGDRRGGARRASAPSPPVPVRRHLPEARAIGAGGARRAADEREGVDRAWAGRGVLYVDRVAERAAQSRLSKIASLPMYRDLTIRNWRTTTELVRLLG